MMVREGAPAATGARRGWTAGHVAIGLAVALVTAVMVGKYLHQDTKDAPVWYDAGRRVLEGESLAGLPSYRYPPTFAVLISPLCLLPFGAFFFLWYALNVVLFFVAVDQTGRLLAAGGREKSGRETAPWPAVLLAAVYAVDNLFLAQTNLVVTVLVYRGFLWSLRRREWWAGLAWGLSVALKAFTAPLLAYLLFRRRWVAAGSMVLSCAFWLLVVPGPVRGWKRNLQEVGAWVERVVAPYVSEGKPGDWGQHALDLGNQSLSAIGYRLLTRVDASVAARRTGPRYVNVAALSESQARFVVRLAFALLAVIFLAGCGWQRPRAAAQEVTEQALVTVGLLLVSGIAWTYFFVMVLLPLAVAMRRREAARPPVRLVLGAGVWAFALATALLPVFYLRAVGSVGLAAMLLYLALAAWAREERAAAQKRAADTPLHLPPQL